MATGGARVGGIHVTIGQAIKGHGGAAYKDHAQQEADQFNPLKGPLGIPCQDSAKERKRKREERMAEPDHLQNQTHSALEHATPVIIERASENPYQAAYECQAPVRCTFEMPPGEGGSSNGKS